MHVDGDRLVWPEGVLTRLNDTVLRFDASLFPDPRGAAIPASITLPVHAFLLQRPDKAPVLIDTGEGGADGGGVARALERIGVARGDIETVVFTHLHGDHRGGYLAGGYGTARVCLSQAEAAYWSGQDHPANQVLAVAGGRAQTLHDGDEVVPGMRVWALPGHTPGHIGLVIDDQIAVVGDLLHRADLQLADPDLATLYDVDPVLATLTRRAALAEISTRAMVLCGGHIRMPGQEDNADGVPFLRLSVASRGWQARPV
jgi:glyoxylase-like metal-dependent hydrolase (beta-lactamase superfamily II)